MEFGKIIRTVRSDFESGAIFDNTNWGFSEIETEVPSFFSPPDPTPEGRIEFLKASKFSSPREITSYLMGSPREITFSLCNRPLLFLLSISRG